MSIKLYENGTTPIGDKNALNIWCRQRAVIMKQSEALYNHWPMDFSATEIQTLSAQFKTYCMQDASSPPTAEEFSGIIAQRREALIQAVAELDDALAAPKKPAQPFYTNVELAMRASSIYSDWFAGL